jgi:hypothetical protein
VIDWVIDATVWGQAARGDQLQLQVDCQAFLLHLSDKKHCIGVDALGHIIRECEKQLASSRSPDIFVIWGTLTKRSVETKKRSKKLRIALQELGVHKEDQIYFFAAEQLSNWLVGCESRWLNTTLRSKLKRRAGLSVCEPKFATRVCAARCSVSNR